MKNKILVLGYGLLGKEIIKQTGWSYISRKEHGFDITDKTTYHLMTQVEFGAIQHCPYNTIINCIANTDTYDEDRDKHWNVNYKGAADLVDFCNDWKVKLVHVSTDYLYSNSKSNASEACVPVHCENWYGYTKLLSDGYVQLKSDNHLIIRCTHKPTPFAYDEAWIDQIGNFDYVDNIAELLIQLINNDCSGTYNVGTDIKSMFNLATNTRAEVDPSLKPKHVPANVTMDIDKLKNAISERK